MIRLGLEDYRPKPEQRAITLADFPQLASILSPPNTAGVTVNERTALNFSAYFNGVDIISGQISTLPLITYRERDDETRERAKSLPAYRLLRSRPNRYMTAPVFWQTVIAHSLTWGNGYAEIEWDKAQRPIALWPVAPDKIEPRVEGNVLRYFYTPTNKPILPEDILHIPGLGFDGIKGYSVIAHARRSLSLGIAAEEFGASFFGNGAWPGLVFSHPAVMSDPAQTRFKASINAEHQGAQRGHKVIVTEEGMKVEKIGIPPEDAQFLETREFQVVEVARWLNLPPHKLKHRVGERPGGNLEASQIEFLTDTLRPWLVRIEAEVNRKLLPEGHYAEHLVDAILRVDGESRARAYKAYFDMGVMDAEYIAQKENLPKPKPKPMPATLSTEPMPMEPDMMGAERALLVDVVGRFVRRESEKVRRAPTSSPAAFQEWVESLYADEAQVLAGMLTPALRVVLTRRGVDTDPAEVAAGLARDYTARSIEELTALPARDLDEHVGRLLTTWQTTRPLAVAERIVSDGDRNEGVKK